jgi:TolB-like protein
MRTFGSGATFRFRDFELDIAGYELRRQGCPVRLERQPMDLLILLVQHRRQLVSRADIVERLWSKDASIDVETGVNTAVSKVRQALRDSAEAPAFIETIPGKGYRFIAAVELIPAADLDASRVKLGVLPFENIGSDPDREYLADGLTEETIATLGQIDPEHLSVIGRTSTMAYKGTRKSLAAIGSELSVHYLIEGSIRGEGGLLRITAKLIRVRDQAQVWSASYDREPTGMLEVQQELSTAIAKQISLWLSPERLNALVQRQTRRAVEYYESATELDPDYSLAWSWLLEWGWPTAETAFRRAVALDPSNAWAHSMLGHVLSQSRRHDEASQFIRRARELEPLSSLHHAMSSQVAFQARDYSAAVEHARQAVVIDPEFWVGYMMRGQAHEQLGESRLALEELAIAARLSGGNSKTISLRGYLLAKLRKVKDAREVLGVLEDVASSIRAALRDGSGQRRLE